MEVPKKLRERSFFIFDNLNQTDIWRSKAEGNRIIIDPSLFSDQK